MRRSQSIKEKKFVIARILTDQYIFFLQIIQS